MGSTSPRDRRTGSGSAPSGVRTLRPDPRGSATRASNGASPRWNDNADLVFPDPTDQDGAVIFQAIDELSRAAAISATMPLNDRRRIRSRITTELTRLEQALVDAVLPPTV